jgi:hypothetical protein
MVVLLLGSSFATAGPPGPQPEVSDSSRFMDTGTNSFTVIDSPYLSPVVTLDAWGAGSYFSGGTGWITVTFSQNEATIVSRTFYVAVTSSSEPAAEGYDNVRLDPGTYEVEVLAMPSSCSLEIYQEAIDGRNEAQRAWDEMELDYLLFIWIAAELVIFSEVYARKSIKSS